MAQYPPPPQPDQQHYNALFPTPSTTQQLVDSVHQDHLQFGSLNQAQYKGDPDGGDHAANQQMSQLARELQQHAAFDEHQRQQLQQAAHEDSPHVVTTANQDPGMDKGQKPNRLRKACDSCSLRKVKCDESGPPCRACVALDIPCTFERPSRRRGPPNRHAEAIKRRRLEDGQPLVTLSSPSSPTHAAQALAALSSQADQQFSAESICPIDLLYQLIEDFFTYIHPLHPFPHEPSFREALKRREDVNNKRFLALIASMIGALVSSFARKSRLFLKQQRREGSFPNHMALVIRCQKIAAIARGPGYIENDGLTIYDAITSYFLGLTCVYTERWRQARMYSGESLTMLRVLELSCMQPKEDPPHPSIDIAPSQDTHGKLHDTYDNITTQMGCRLFWAIYSNAKILQQTNSACTDFVLPPLNGREMMPPVPAEVDDFCVYPSQNEQQPLGLLAMTSGFNAVVHILHSYTFFDALEMAQSRNRLEGLDQRIQSICDSLQMCKFITLDLPPELNSNVSNISMDEGSEPPLGFVAPQMLRDPASSLHGFPQPGDFGQTPEQRRQVQHQLQRANIYASHLSTRHYLVEKYWRMREVGNVSGREVDIDSALTATSQLDSAAPDSSATAHSTDYTALDAEMRQERDNILREVLFALAYIDRVNMEANSDNFVSKIRSLAGRFLLDASSNRNSELAKAAQEPLDEFLKTLARLETPDRDQQGEPSGDNNPEAESETVARDLATLQTLQSRFIQLASEHTAK